jgi:mannose-6-phosphate isomerase-like protein (cupin superfamily)
MSEFAHMNPSYIETTRINLNDKLALFSDQWNPKIIAELNGQHVKLAKLKGRFVWHRHESEDELFLVIAGSVEIEFRDKTIRLTEGEMLVVPKGVEHRPNADEEAHVLLFEPVTTLNTGDATGDRTVRNLTWI